MILGFALFGLTLLCLMFSVGYAVQAARSGEERFDVASSRWLVLGANFLLWLVVWSFFH